MSILNNRNRSEYAFPLATQSNEIQLKYYEQHGLTLSAPEKTALQKVKPSPVQRPLDSYTDADREKIGFWQDVVDQWMLYRSQTGKPLSELDHKFVQHMRVENPGVELSVPTLYRKKKALDEGDLDGVIDRRGKARKGKTDMPEYIKKGCRMVTPCDRSCRGQSCCGCCGSPPGLHQTGTLWQPYDEGCCHRTQKDQPLACMHLQGRLRREWMQDIEEEDTDDGTDKQTIGGGNNGKARRKGVGNSGSRREVAERRLKSIRSKFRADERAGRPAAGSRMRSITAAWICAGYPTPKSGSGMRTSSALWRWTR